MRSLRSRRRSSSILPTRAPSIIWAPCCSSGGTITRPASPSKRPSGSPHTGVMPGTTSPRSMRTWESGGTPCNPYRRRSTSIPPWPLRRVRIAILRAFVRTRISSPLSNADQSWEPQAALQSLPLTYTPSPRFCHDPLVLNALACPFVCIRRQAFVTSPMSYIFMNALWHLRLITS
jgi:hypothetical protein